MADFQCHIGDMHTKMMNLIKVGDDLEKDYAELKAQGPPLTEAVRQQIITEYKESPELIEAVIRQLDEGYQDTNTRMRERMRTTGLDPKVLNSSDRRG